MAFRNRQQNTDIPVSEEQPCQELHTLIDSVENRLEKAREAYREKLIKEALTPTTENRPFLGRFLRRAPAPSDSTAEKSGDDSPSWVTLAEPGPLKIKPDLPIQQYEFEDEEGFVEDLRRISELAVIGENLVTSHNKKRKEVQSGLKGEDELDDFGERESGVENAAAEERLQLFDIFFERNVLEFMVNLLTGKAMDLSQSTLREKESTLDDLADKSSDDEAEPTKGSDVENDAKLLPGIKIATQAIQSISILIQNASRATSLYVILSNNHINTLIDLQLDEYETAERARQQSEAKDGTMTLTFKSPELVELTTHFVTFLKSLAMRINSETLQFYLAYPNEHIENERIASTSSHSHFDSDHNDQLESGGPEDEGTSEMKVPRPPKMYSVEFPLYDRALDFCAAHHDSFVRVTALNICLNTLRLTTLIGEQDMVESGSESGSPDGVLHSTTLPFRERLAIAQHACSPFRVEKLVAPMFSKLAERWNALQESIKEIDAHIASGTKAATKVGQAKEKVKRQRLLRGFRDKADNLHDELLLLDDVFKVGLIVLNEQTIEMMFATFVYPLLLQPLLLYYQRFDSVVDRSRNEKIDHPFGGYGGDFSHADSALEPVSSSAKTSLFTLASVFHFCTNQALARILFTSLFHPLSPDSSSVPTVRSKVEVASPGADGEWRIRVDPSQNTGSGGLLPNSRSTYDFGTNPLNRRKSSSNAAALEQLEGTEACVFVLAPALAEILEFRGEDIALITRTRPNPYRRAMLQCLDVPYEMEEVRQLSVFTFDAALSVFDSNFSADILFGLDIRTRVDDVPLDERNLDSSNAYTMNNRGIGFSGKNESRMSLGRQTGGSGGTDLTVEIISALCTATVYASKDRFGGFFASFDEIAAHALLFAVQSNGKAQVHCSKILDARLRLASAFLARRIIDLQNTTGGGVTFLANGSPTVNSPDFEEQVLGGIVDSVFYQSNDSEPNCAVVEGFKELKSDVQSDRSACSMCVASRCSFKAMRDCVGSRLASEESDLQYDLQQLADCRDSTRAIVRTSCLLPLLQDLAATGGAIIEGRTLQGLAIGLFGRIVDMSDVFTGNLKQEIYAPLSPEMSSVLFSSGQTDLPQLGSVIPLVGRLALPCVCEVQPSMAHLFADEGSGVVAEGVTWQSLYLAFIGDCLVMVQPEPGESAGNGRVISVSVLERISAEVDKQPDTTSPARRLRISYKWFDPETPSLFMFDEMPTRKSIGPFVKIEPMISTLDVWFENQRAAGQALQIFTQSTFAARSRRGRRVFNFLTPGELLGARK